MDKINYNNETELKNIQIKIPKYGNLYGKEYYKIILPPIK